MTSDPVVRSANGGGEAKEAEKEETDSPENGSHEVLKGCLISIYQPAS